MCLLYFETRIRRSTESEGSSGRKWRHRDGCVGPWCSGGCLVLFRGRDDRTCCGNHGSKPSAAKSELADWIHTELRHRKFRHQLDQQQPSSVQRSRGHVRLALSLMSMPCHTSDYPQSAPLTGSACRRHDLPAAPCRRLQTLYSTTHGLPLCPFVSASLSPG